METREEMGPGARKAGRKGEKKGPGTKQIENLPLDKQIEILHKKIASMETREEMDGPEAKLSTRLAKLEERKANQPEGNTGKGHKHLPLDEELKRVAKQIAALKRKGDEEEKVAKLEARQTKLKETRAKRPEPTKQRKAPRGKGAKLVPLEHQIERVTKKIDHLTGEVGMEEVVTKLEQKKAKLEQKLEKSARKKPDPGK